MQPLNQQQQNSQNFLNEQPAAPSSPDQLQGGDRSNFLTKLLPVGGSILGGIVGIPGDLISGGLSSVAGAGLGSAAGKGLENILEGGDVTKDLGASALEGGIGQVAGLGLGKLGGALLGKIGGAATNTAENQALKSGFGGLKQSVRENLGFGNAVDFAKQNGIDLTPESFQAANQAANGNGGVFTSLRNQAINTVRPTLDLGRVGEDVGNAINKNSILGQQGAETVKGKQLVSASNAANDVQAELRTLLDPLATRGNGGLDPETAHQVLQNVGSRVGDYKQIVQNALTQGTDNSMAKAKLNVFGTAYNSLKDQLYPKAVDDFVANYKIAPGSPEEAQVLNATGGNQKLANNFISTINNAGEMQHLLDPMQQLGNMGKLGTQALRQSTNAIPGVSEEGTMGGNAIMGAATGGNPIMSLLSAVGHPLMAPLAGAAKLMGGAAPGTVAKGAQMGVNILGKPGVSSVLPQLATHLPSLGSSPAGGADQTQLTGDTTMSPTNGAPDLGLGNADLGQQMRLASLFNPASLPALQGAQKAQSGADALQTLEAAYSHAGGAQGAGGILSALTSLIPGTPAYMYNQQKAAAASALAAALGVHPADIAGALPGLMSDSTGASNAFSGLNSRLATMASPANTAPVGGSSVLTNLSPNLGVPAPSFGGGR